MKQIKSSVAERVQNDSNFDSIGFKAAFKGFAVFEEACLADDQEILSSSDCLGFIFPYKARGPKGVAVLQMSYAKMHCAVKWGKLFKIKAKEDMDQEILRALRRLFPCVDIPKPLESLYVYWEDGYK
ncbi:hypothetical protein OS493_016382 [Desmophyllum pertusum]|uniref:Amine oxidase domain-containing protein n=1 Tax=Desmophyllum pertusum TaxID=174260 RepID=A0A9W9ZP51_9CNID|nr:hypothetical protein OS493_016382 [Desmophyllum pertusum]